MDITSFTALYHRAADPQQLMSPFISGHLVVEFLLRKLVQIYDPSLTRHSDDLRHAALIALNYDLGTISDAQRTVLVSINSMRNKFAHRITYELALEELKKLYTEASRAFTDLTDGIQQGSDAIASASAIEDLDEWVIPELFIQIAYDLHDEFQRRGGDDEAF